MQANTSEMINNRLTLLLDDDMEAVATAADQLRQLLPDINIDRFVEAYPLVLDVDDFQIALEVGEINFDDQYLGPTMTLIIHHRP